MRVLTRLRLPPHTALYAWPDVDTGPGCPSARAPSKTPVDCHRDGEPFHREQLPLDSIMGRVSQRAIDVQKKIREPDTNEGLDK